MNERHDVDYVIGCDHLDELKRTALGGGPVNLRRRGEMVPTPPYHALPAEGGRTTLCGIEVRHRTVSKWGMPFSSSEDWCRHCEAKAAQ